MLFCSIEFIFLFLPVFLLIYYSVPAKYGNLVLFLGSLFFYAYGERQFFWLILVSLVLHYTLTRFAEGRSRRCQTFCLVILLFYGFGMLFFFKYMDFFAENWNQLALYLAERGSAVQLPQITVPQVTLPLGISFYTFQIAAYAIDVYRGQVKPEKKLIDLGAFLCMFPQLIAGPIVLYHEVAERLKKRCVNWHHMENGIKTFIIGLSLKMLLANTFGTLWNQIQTAGISAASVPMAWLGALAYTFQIYFDFQGYSMMAMGLGEMLGFRIPRNFRHPYMATSVTDFWRRWHMTLSSWFRNYVYIPLGGSRHGKVRMIFNMLVVWALTGLWHGAGWNFILWGLYYFTLLVVEKLFLQKVFKRFPVIGWCFTMTAVITGWVIFAIDNMELLKIYLIQMFGHLGQISQWTMNGDILMQTLQQYGLYLFMGVVFSVSWPYTKYKEHKNKLLTVLILFVLFLMCVYKMYTAASNPFLYFRF